MGHAPSRRPVVRLLFAALVTTASCVSVFGLEEENYGPLEEELCNFAAKICTPSDNFSLSSCLAGEIFSLSDYMMSEAEACFEKTDCQAFLNCIPNDNPVACDETCVAVGEPCTNSGCPNECCEYAQCIGAFCCWPDPQHSYTSDQQCCNATLCVNDNTCGGSSG